LRRSVWERRQPERYTPLDFCSNLALLSIDDDPRTVKEEMDSKHGKLCKKAMVEEMATLDNKESWDLVELSSGINIIGNKWVFKKNLNAEGKVEKCKARYVEKGYSRVDRIDFGEICYPIANLTSIRFILSLAIAFNFQVE
jgi:hypothetical protein